MKLLLCWTELISEMKKNYRCNVLFEYWIAESKVQVVPVHAMKAYRGGAVELHSFLTSALNGGEWSTSCPSHFIPSTEPDMHWLGAWVVRKSQSVCFGEKSSCHCWDLNPRLSSLKVQIQIILYLNWEIKLNTCIC